MPLYIADYLSATEHLDAAHSGAYLHLIMHYWQKGKLPIEDKFLARISRMTDRQWAVAKPTLQAFFSDGWNHNRINSELANAQLKAEARASSGSRGGLAKALKNNKPHIANATGLLQQTTSKLPSESLPSSSGLGTEKEEKEATASSSTVVDLKAAKALARVEGDQKLLDRITDCWNAWAASHGSPQVRYLTGQRSIHCRRRINDLLCGASIEEAETVFSRLLTACEQSFFVRGNPRSPLKFDQLMNEGFMVKMMEGAFTYVPERKNSWRA
jgi:uncharacterized protein YdaU (DUF1376 family)